MQGLKHGPRAWDALACNCKCNACNKQSLLFLWKLHSDLNHLNLRSLRSSLNLSHKYRIQFRNNAYAGPHIEKVEALCSSYLKLLMYACIINKMYQFRNKK